MAGRKLNEKGSGFYGVEISEQQKFENEIYKAVLKYKDVDIAWKELKKKYPTIGRWRVEQEVPRNTMVALRIKNNNKPFAGTLLGGMPNVGLKN